MLRVNEYRFYELGMKLHPLAELQDECLYQSYFWQLYDRRDEVLKLLEEMPLRVCRPASNEFVNAANVIVSRDLEDAIAASNIVGAIPKYSAYRIRTAVKKLETVLSAELQAMDTYFLSQKGTHSTPDLIERAEIMFPENIRDDLPQTAIDDWREAGRCLALDTPTACGFHILRAVEAVMALYYHLVVGKPVPTRMRNWGIYIKKLREVGTGDEKITVFLDHIRENYRNPVSHPEIILSLDEVEVLFGVASSCIRQMIIAMQEINRVAALRKTISFAAPEIQSPTTITVPPVR